MIRRSSSRINRKEAEEIQLNIKILNNLEENIEEFKTNNIGF